MKVKYDDEFSPLRNEHHGYTFIPSNYSQSGFPGQKNDRKRRYAQWLRQQCNQKAITYWRNMSADTKQNWIDFAAAFPQPSNKDPNVFLSGYQLFLKRNSFCFLNHGITSDFMEEPEMIVSDEYEISLSIESSESQIDCTQNYIDRFGLLPKIGDHILMYANVYGEYNGNFYSPVYGSYQVLEVFVDGLFVNVNIPDEFEDIVVSLYMSKPVSAGQSYIGSKIRYMGCFTKKKFIELTDTPPSYAGQAGKIPVVNPTEDGLLFQAGAGGNNAFNPINVSGQASVNADVAATPLELVAGANMSIVTDAANKKITFSAASSGNSAWIGQEARNYANPPILVRINYPTDYSYYFFRHAFIGGWNSVVEYWVCMFMVVQANTGGTKSVVEMVNTKNLSWSWSDSGTYIEIIVDTEYTGRQRSYRYIAQPEDFM